MRPIESDALIEIVEDGLINNPHKDGYARVCHRTEYTHFLDVIHRMPTIAPLPNDPLTLEELREMDGEWVFCVSTAKQEDAAWGIVRMRKICPYVSALRSSDEIGTIFSLATYGSMWLAYRHKPEEEST